MKKEKTSQIKQIGLAIAATFIAVGCTDSPIVSTLLTNDSLAQANTAEVSGEPNPTDLATNSEVIEFEVCAAVDSWQRPSESEQAKRLGQDARYAEALSGNEPENSLKMASSQFWDRQIISFTTYGLSARMEPINLSGLWTIEDELESCYELELTEAINVGDRAEAWLLNQQITSLQWDGSRYVMTVAPVSVGMQVVQFERADSLETLPLTVVTASGQPVEVASGDWQ
ncbi:hypothetical protein [cf. Phormidesmis sp. LEGE 11477]|uniref:hypothetical protein n=1 Tax=cf. Phormidesmis sp. LEGE 11477 TaxID=1828680 RepID=UPI0018804B8C|nr:hypothetical protein [cf. Phormidesmis sp. LEGE 11477]MBE9062438.1 hypothetical protein [cf. Phormidesmis sp. LEGE 11477]